MWTEADERACELRVTCSSCGGHLYTDHTPDCPVLLAQETILAEFAESMAEMFEGYKGVVPGEGSR